MNLIGHLDLCLILAAVVWLLSVITREYSWIDRLWSLCPPVYCLLVAAGLDFASSTRLTESISAAKYPAYRDYQASTPALVPRPRSY